MMRLPCKIYNDETYIPVFAGSGKHAMGLL